MPERTGRTDTEVGKLFERISVQAPILPPNLEAKRLQSPVCDSLPIKTRPDIQDYRKFQSTDQLAEDPYGNFLTFASPFILQTVGEETTEPILIMDKLQAHSLYELMLISASPQTLSGISDHSSETRQRIFTIMSQFPVFAKEQGLYPYIAFNYDPQTLDRESGQSEKRFHGHLLGRTPQEMLDILHLKVKLADISPIRRRRLVDETTVLGSLLANDFLESNVPFSTMRSIAPFTERECPSLLLQLQNGWDTLTSEAFDLDFLHLHVGLKQAYDALSKAVTEGATGVWERPSVKKIDNPFVYDEVVNALNGISWLTPESLNTLLYFLHRMRPQITARTIQNLQRPLFRDVTTHMYPMADLSYDTAFFEEDNIVYAVIRPHLFSDLGGAGVEYLSGITTKIKRGVGVFSASEMASRKQFQQDFLTRFTQ